ncbi:TonB-dependent receptor domain-containing protein [Pontibacter sp. G13]|uniref:TonB-dependent receptor n=1 Tax=Pontibacter sp. G13 TaxID=3074898 RepID=UPI0028896826|nr:TonB-dependent receptor [Pontibacter sp. G13]WNJ15953.1 TonB-dependent receptor plug domain-containing protein [Pontibacter sp. G13]
MLLCISLCLGTQVWAQSFTISGYVSDATSGEKLINAKVFDSLSQQGIITNNFGFFSLTLPAGEVNLIAVYAGFEASSIPFELKKDTQVVISLAPYQTDVVEIVADEVERIEERVEMSTVTLSPEEIKKLPMLLGEVDVVKAIQLLPGVQSGNEGSTGLYVRGGGPDQNLILLDDVPLYYVSHLGGFFSVFNADAISQVKLTKGGFPARYGGRISSVLDVRMKEGNMREFHGQGSIGILASKFSFEGPIIKDKASFIISGRRTYFDLLTRPISRIASRQSSGGEAVASFGYYFYDLNAKVNYVISPNDRLYLSGYMGDDDLGLKLTEEFGTPNEDLSILEFDTGSRWGNRVAALRWNHIWNPKVFSNLTATFTNYRFKVENDFYSEEHFEQEILKAEGYLGYQSGIRDFALKYDMEFYPNPKHEIRVGANTTLHKFSPGLIGYSVSEADTSLLDTTIGSEPINSLESYVYVEDLWKVNDRLTFHLGLHGSHYRVDQSDYWSLQPRVSARFLATDRLSLKGSFVTMTQFLHLLTNSGTGLPVDLWVPATDRVPPQRSWQVALGAATTLRDGWELSVEGYYKEMKTLIEYREGTNFFLSLEESDWQDRVVSGGTGTAYGAEVLLQKRKGATTGWLGYTLSWNNRQFDELNQGEVYPYKFDRRHDASLVVAHTFNKRVSLSGTWVFGTGNAMTVPTGRYATPSANGYDRSFFPIFYGSNSVNLYEEGRNNFRMEAYHRFDIGVNFTKDKKWGERTISMGLYNAYGRKNPYMYYISQEREYLPNGEYRSETNLTRFSLFPVPIPYFTYSFSF